MAMRDEIRKGILQQAAHCRANDAPVTGAICETVIVLAKGYTRCGRIIADWPGNPIEDALALRIAGGLHHLRLTGHDTRLNVIYDRDVTDQDEINAIVAAVVHAHDDELASWFDGPPQTNEAGRSANIMAALLWLSDKVGARFELLEIGASAGINTMMPRYHYDLGDVEAGPAGSPMRIRPEWKGAPPPHAHVDITSIRGCDVNPVDLTDPKQAMRLRSYVWPENPERMARLDNAIAFAREHAPDLVQADAADWMETQLAMPQDAGTVRALFHTIVWQYIPESGRKRIHAAMNAAAAKADAERPLAWISLETNRATMRHELKVRYWPGQKQAVHLANAHAHGKWVEWLG